MFKNLDPQDISKKAFQSFKRYNFSNNSSGSGVYSIKARSGSAFNYVSSSDDFTTITSGSVSTNFYSYPTYAMLSNLFYSILMPFLPKFSFFYIKSVTSSILDK